MNSLLQEISLLVEDFGSAPKLEEMPKRTLADKGILSLIHISEPTRP